MPAADPELILTTLARAAVPDGTTVQTRMPDSFTDLTPLVIVEQTPGGGQTVYPGRLDRVAAQIDGIASGLATARKASRDLVLDVIRALDAADRRQTGTTGGWLHGLTVAGPWPRPGDDLDHDMVRHTATVTFVATNRSA